MAKRTSLIIFSCLFVSNLWAGPRADQLFWSCKADTKTPQEAFKKMYCVGYLNGLLDSYIILSTVNKKIRSACLPKRGISTDQLLRLYIKWIETHPKDMHESARVIFLVMLKDAFPCRNKKN